MASYVSRYISACATTRSPTSACCPANFSTPNQEEQREERLLRVEDVMQPVAMIVATEADTVREALNNLTRARQKAVLIQSASGSWYAATRELLSRLSDEGKANAKLGTAIPNQPIPHLHPDQPLEIALRYVYEWPVLPVVHRAHLNKMEGVVSLHDVLQTYRQFSETVPIERVKTP